MKGMPVYTVRPTLTNEARWANFISTLLALALAAWLVMLLLPLAFDVSWGYWRVLAAILVVRWTIGLKWPIPPKYEEVK